MVSHPGTSSRAGQLRPLNRPRAVKVIVQGNRPAVLVDTPHRHRIEHIQDTWIIDDEWWRDSITRQYFQVLLEGGMVRTIFHDRASDTWFAQSY